MTIPDVNLLIHAYNSNSPVHRQAREWWEGLLSHDGPVGLPWVVLLGFIRISTHSRVLENPVPVDRACQHVESWLRQPHVLILRPGERHASLLLGLLRGLGTAGNLTADAHLAALAIEHQAVIHTTDADFARFPGLRWINPIRG